MKIIQNEKFTELIPDKKYLTNKDETDIFEGLCGKNINPDDYKDISDEEAEIILKRLSEEKEELADVEIT